MSTGHHADTLDTVAGFAGGGEESVAALPGRRARGGARVVVPVPQRREPGAGAGGAAPHRRAAARLPEATPARPDRRRRGGVDHLGRAPTSASAGCTSRPSAIARLGLLLLHDGVWQGRQVLPAGWVATASSALADTSHHPDPADWKVGYGYQMWRSRHGFRADGAYGQFALVLPDHDLVVAVTSCTETTHEVLEAVWGELLPHLSDAALPADPVAQERLRSALEQATAPPRRSTTTPPGADGPWAFTHAPTSEHPALRSVVVHRCRRAAGPSRSTTESRCRSPAATDTGRMPVARPGSRAAAGLRPACSRRRSSRTRRRTRCCCGAPRAR